MPWPWGLTIVASNKFRFLGGYAAWCSEPTKTKLHFQFVHVSLIWFDILNKYYITYAKLGSSDELHRVRYFQSNVNLLSVWIIPLGIPVHERLETRFETYSNLLKFKTFTPKSVMESYNCDFKKLQLIGLMWRIFKSYFNCPLAALWLTASLQTHSLPAVKPPETTGFALPAALHEQYQFVLK